MRAVAARREARPSVRRRFWPALDQPIGDRPGETGPWAEKKMENKNGDKQNGDMDRDQLAGEAMNHATSYRASLCRRQPYSGYSSARWSQPGKSAFTEVSPKRQQMLPVWSAGCD